MREMCDICLSLQHDYSQHHPPSLLARMCLLSLGTDIARKHPGSILPQAAVLAQHNASNYTNPCNYRAGTY